MPRGGLAKRITRRAAKVARPKIKTGRKVPLISVALRGRKRGKGYKI